MRDENMGAFINSRHPFGLEKDLLEVQVALLRGEFQFEAVLAGAIVFQPRSCNALHSCRECQFQHLVF